jgi:hypothetical protein
VRSIKGFVVILDHYIAGAAWPTHRTITFFSPTGDMLTGFALEDFWLFTAAATRALMELGLIEESGVLDLTRGNIIRDYTPDSQPTPLTPRL